MTDEFLDIDVSNVRAEDQRRTWTPDRERELRVMLKLNHMSRGQMAAEMGVTRNALIGKIDRMGLCVPRPAITEADRAAWLSHRNERRRTRSAAIRAGHVMPKRRAPIIGRTVPVVAPVAKLPWTPRPRVVEPAEHVSASPVSIVDLTAQTCRWPLWADYGFSPAKMYCGNEVVPERVYCRVHMLMRRRAKGEQ